MNQVRIVSVDFDGKQDLFLSEPLTQQILEPVGMVKQGILLHLLRQLLGNLELPLLDPLQFLLDVLLLQPGLDLPHLRVFDLLQQILILR